MKHPPYHLRPNKAVDRLLFVDSIRRLEKIGKLADYTYYGLGGPYLEDFRLLYEFCPDIGMVSLEKNAETFKRQGFHRPCANVKIQRDDLNSFLVHYSPAGKKCVFWLDYSEPVKNEYFGEFGDLLGKAVEHSMIKITIPFRPADFADLPGSIEKAQQFRSQFGSLIPDPSADPPIDPDDFGEMLIGMLMRQTQSVMPELDEKDLTFQPISSFQYLDGNFFILTLAGIVCQVSKKKEVQTLFEGLRFPNFSWSSPKEIDVPVLSTKERLHLQQELPCSENPAKTLGDALGYKIDGSQKSSAAKLKQYADFHRHYPFFMKVVP